MDRDGDQNLARDGGQEGGREREGAIEDLDDYNRHTYGGCRSCDHRHKREAKADEGDDQNRQSGDQNDDRIEARHKTVHRIEDH